MYFYYKLYKYNIIWKYEFEIVQMTEKLNKGKNNG